MRILKYTKKDSQDCIEFYVDSSDKLVVCITIGNSEIEFVFDPDDVFDFRNDIDDLIGSNEEKLTKQLKD